MASHALLWQACTNMHNGPGANACRLTAGALRSSVQKQLPV